MVVARFVKSASAGRSVTVRMRRILTFIVIPFWLLGLTWTSINSYHATRSTISYYELKGEKRWHHDYGSNWPYHIQLEYEKSGIVGFWTIPLYVFVFFLLPWVIVRIVFWIKDADKTIS